MKKISSKINYDVLRDLNRSDTGSASPETGNSESNMAASSEKKGLKRQRSRKKDRSKGLAATANTFGKRLRPLISPSTKKNKTTLLVEPAVTATAAPSEALEPASACDPILPSEPAPDPLPETAPAPPPDPMEVGQLEDPHTEEDEEEEEEQCVSALQLIGDYGCEAEEEEIY